MYFSQMIVIIAKTSFTAINITIREQDGRRWFIKP